MSELEEEVLIERIDFDDGFYEGEVDEEGRMCGHGKATWNTGESYEGDWYNDKMHGNGRYTWEDGDYYEGEYSEGLQHGNGEMLDQAGKYIGQWAHDERHGLGRIEYTEGSVYEGEWANNVRHGQGRFVDVTGDVYEGEYVNDVRQGRGILRNHAGEVYEGEFANELPNGAGTYKWADGSSYVGEFLNGMKHGQGCERLPNGDWVAGQWANGKHDGKQTVHTVDQAMLIESNRIAEENAAKLNIETLDVTRFAGGSVSGSLSRGASQQVIGSLPGSPQQTLNATAPGPSPPSGSPSAPATIVAKNGLAGEQQHEQAEAPSPSIVPPAFITASLSEGDLEGWKSVKMLGKGSFGAVYEAQLKGGITCCVKVIELGNITDRTELDKLRNEIALMKRLHHSHIVQYYGSLEDSVRNSILIFMELVTGGSINAFVKKFKTIPADTTRHWTYQMVCGVKYLHDCGIVHRDIKGDNVLVTNDGVLKLADFGCSKAIDDVCSKTHGCQTMVGTPYWMAPEVIKCDSGGYGMKSDVWSIGCTVVEMITGKPPWPECNSMWAAVYKIANSTGLPTEIPKDLDPLLMNFLERCFERDPSKRPSAAELLEHQYLAPIVSQVAAAQAGTA